MSDDLTQRFLNTHELIGAARARLDKNGWDYLVGGSETETTLRRNRHALDRIALRPRVLRDVSHIDHSATFLGHAARLPVLLAPVGGLETFDPEGALAVARGAASFGVPMMMSSVSPRGKAEVARAAQAGAIFQLYVRAGGRHIEDQVEQAIDAGMRAFCLTVDTALYSRRERDIANRFVKPWRLGVDGDSRRHQAALTWQDVARVRKAFKFPLILKGIATVEDAQLAVEHGVDMIYVSNHGGRQLDHGRGSMDVLPGIVDAVARRARIIVDGGFSRATDIIKALALGADMVGLGRLYCYGLAAAGSAGIVRGLEILADEMVSAMGLLGVTRLDEITAACVYRDDAVVCRPSVHSAFPLLDWEC